jgi:hypothetical protein
MKKFVSLLAALAVVMLVAAAAIANSVWGGAHDDPKVFLWTGNQTSSVAQIAEMADGVNYTRVIGYAEDQDNGAVIQAVRTDPQDDAVIYVCDDAQINSDFIDPNEEVSVTLDVNSQTEEVDTILNATYNLDEDGSSYTYIP